MYVCRQRFFKVKVEGEQSMSSSFLHVNLEDKEIILIDKAGVVLKGETKARECT